VTGEHTGNVGVVNMWTRELEQVIAISKPIPGCTAPAGEVEEPHVHGVQVDPETGFAFVTDEGEHCYYESITLIDRR
jgi:hypothetical protein